MANGLYMNWAYTQLCVEHTSPILVRPVAKGITEHNTLLGFFSFLLFLWVSWKKWGVTPRNGVTAPKQNNCWSERPFCFLKRGTWHWVSCPWINLKNPSRSLWIYKAEMLLIMVPIRVELENLLQLRSIDSYTGWHKGESLDQYWSVEHSSPWLLSRTNTIALLALSEWIRTYMETHRLQIMLRP